MLKLDIPLMQMIHTLIDRLDTQVCGIKIKKQFIIHILLNH